MAMPFVYKILSSEELNCFAFVSSLNPLYPRECKHAYPPFTDNWGTGTFRRWQIYVYIKVYQTMIISSFVNFFFNLYGIQRKPFSVLLYIYQSFNSRRPMEAVHEHQSWKNLLCHFLLHTW